MDNEDLLVDTERSSPPERRVFCNRTLNLGYLKAIGYDLDYTLIQYRMEPWEGATFSFLREKLQERGWPVGEAKFDPLALQVGLFIDRHLGNIIKADQFGYVKRGKHGTRALSFEELRTVYSGELVELPDPRYVFLNTLFSLSEASMYAQLVDHLDAGDFSTHMGYSDLYDELKRSFDETHREGELKREIMSRPDDFVVLDPETPQALLDQRQAGKKLLLITNSDWPYTRFMMDFAFSPYLPTTVPWRDLFNVIIVSAHKPAFFTEGREAFEVVSDDGLLKPLAGKPTEGQILLGGNVVLVEEMLGLKGSDFLYVGDHAFGDVHVSKNYRRWRTALVLRELEEEIRVQEEFRSSHEQLTDLMREKERLEVQLARKRLELQRKKLAAATDAEIEKAKTDLNSTRRALLETDGKIVPLAKASANLLNEHWGLHMRSGNDRSYLARIIERHADIYTSRVSNFLRETPFAFFRAHRGLLPHD
jgi:HAD superfamily 5'-nucleotidase-like hydrolase